IVKILILALLLISAFIYAILGLDGTAFGLRAVDFHCAVGALKLAIPVWIGLPFIELVVPRMSRGFHAWITFIGISAGMIMVNISCPLESHGHPFLGHSLLPLFASVIGASFVMSLSKMIVKYIFHKK